MIRRGFRTRFFAFFFVPVAFSGIVFAAGAGAAVVGSSELLVFLFVDELCLLWFVFFVGIFSGFFFSDEVLFCVVLLVVDAVVFASLAAEIAVAGTSPASISVVVVIVDAATLLSQEFLGCVCLLMSRRAW